MNIYLAYNLSDLFTEKSILFTVAINSEDTLDETVAINTNLTRVS